MLSEPLPNPNIQWAATFVAELAACGLEAVCIAPGSRSTPLTLAFDRHPEIAVYLHLDERSAGFAALGMALATDRPVAVVCTSGTAAAEFFAAVIEARQSQIPLLVLTADRPHELRQSGANQTIDQVKLYGDQVLWSVDVALPEPEMPAALANLCTLAARAYACANGIVQGPVHLNFPFRKPLEPETLAAVPVMELPQPHTEIARGRLLPNDRQLDAIAAKITSVKRGIIVCGPRCPTGAFPQAVAELSRRSGFPTLADPLSGVRYGPQIEGTAIISTYDSLLNPAAPTWEPPDLILRFGAVPTSKWLNAYLTAGDPDAVIHVRASGVWADDSHRVTHFLQVDEAAFCSGLMRRLGPAEGRMWAERWIAADGAARAGADAYFAAKPFDAAYVAALVDLLPANANLFVGNSLPIRHVDQFGFSRAAPLHVYANRGASGIDGTTSSALGIAAAEPARPLIFLTGDVAFYHDMNGLLALRQHDLRNVIIVLLNNDGGGIFRRLPVAGLDPAFTDLFVTPHGLDFSHAAALYGLSHTSCTSLDHFHEAFATALGHEAPTLLEIQTDGADDVAHVTRARPLSCRSTADARSMNDWLAERAAVTPERVALIAEDGAERTYGELDAAVAALAGRLASRGVAPGDRVAALLPSDVAFAELVHALVRLQAVLVPLNVRLTSAELLQQILRVEPKLLLLDDARPAHAFALTASGVATTTLDALPGGSPLYVPSAPFDLAATQAILFTSGTTGAPKGATLSFGNHFWSATASAYRLGVNPTDRWLSCLPLYHVGGLAVLFRSCLYGTAVLLRSRFDAATYHAAIDHQGVTLTSLVPTMLHRLLATREKPWPSTLRLVLLGGAAASPPLIAEAARQKLPVATTYGLTEAASQVATALPETVATKPGTVGKPLLFTTVRIIDEGGDTLPAGEIGEVVVRGPGIMPGYLDDPAATATAIRGGELHTGDMGYLDADGDLWIVQRRSELIVSGGENVYPAEVEQVLDSHPAVARSCVVGIDDLEWGQRVAALVELATEKEVDVSTLLDFAAERLAGYKRPRRLFFAAELPLTASGKIARQTVREWVAAREAEATEAGEEQGR